jgi:hypothetical protein
MIRLIQQKELESSVEKVFAVILDLKDKIGPLRKKLIMSKSHEEKESLTHQIETTGTEREKATKVALVEIVKAYEVFCVYFVCKACTQWDKVVQEMHMKDPWVAVNGSLNPGPQKKTWESFLDCIGLHKLTVFPCDAAELQRYYMQQYIKKPQRVTVRAFVTRMGLLNDYLAYLPTVKDSPRAVEDTKKGNVPFNEADLAGIMLKAIPISWVNQYNLNHSTLPKSLRLLLPALENIEPGMNEKRMELPKARANDGTATAGAKSNSPKKRASAGSSEQVSKKVCTAKFCQHCKNNGWPHMTHNTKECRKYDKDRKAVPASRKKLYKKKPYKKHEGADDKQMAFLTDAIESLAKQGLQKAVKKKREKRFRDDSSSDSNSE